MDVSSILNMQLTLFDPLPNLFQSLRKMFDKNWIRINFGKFRKKRLVVSDELEQEVGRLDALVQGEQPVHSPLPEDAHRPEHDLVELDKPVAVLVVAEEERVGVKEGGLVVDEPEWPRGRAQAQVVDCLAHDRRTFLLISSILIIKKTY